jgi:hypothetical protein
VLCVCVAGLSRDNWAYIAYGLTALTAVIWLLTLVMLRRIQVAVACIKVSFQVGYQPGSIIIPGRPVQR